MIKLFLIILLLLCPPLLAQQDVTVNFPDSMTVEGSVSIQNLSEDMGITGYDPDYSTAPFLEPEAANLEYSQTTNIPENTANIDVAPQTYVKYTKQIKLWSGGVGANQSGQNAVFLKIPEIQWSFVKSDFVAALFGRYATSNQQASSSLTPALTGRSTLTYQPWRDVECSVHDPLGNLSYNYSFSLGRTIFGTGNNSTHSIFGYDLNFKGVFSYILIFAVWYEVVYGIIFTIKNG